jgi:hypothetical protein
MVPQPKRLKTNRVVSSSLLDPVSTLESMNGLTISREMILEFYSLHDPSKNASDIDRVYLDFRGNAAGLAEGLWMRYGVTIPLDLPGEMPGALGQVSRVAAAPLPMPIHLPLPLPLPSAVLSSTVLPHLHALNSSFSAGTSGAPLSPANLPAWRVGTQRVVWAPGVGDSIIGMSQSLRVSFDRVAMERKMMEQLVGAFSFDESPIEESRDAAKPFVFGREKWLVGAFAFPCNIAPWLATTVQHLFDACYGPPGAYMSTFRQQICMLRSVHADKLSKAKQVFDAIMLVGISASASAQEAGVPRFASDYEHNLEDQLYLANEEVVYQLLEPFAELAETHLTSICELHFDDLARWLRVAWDEEPRPLNVTKPCSTQMGGAPVMTVTEETDNAVAALRHSMPRNGLDVSSPCVANEGRAGLNNPPLEQRLDSMVSLLNHIERIEPELAFLGKLAEMGEEQARRRRGTVGSSSNGVDSSCQEYQTAAAARAAEAASAEAEFAVPLKLEEGSEVDRLEEMAVEMRNRDNLAVAQVSMGLCVTAVPVAAPVAIPAAVPAAVPTAAIPATTPTVGSGDYVGDKNQGGGYYAIGDESAEGRVRRQWADATSGIGSFVKVNQKRYTTANPPMKHTGMLGTWEVSNKREVETYGRFLAEVGYPWFLRQFMLNALSKMTIVDTGTTAEDQGVVISAVGKYLGFKLESGWSYEEIPPIVFRHQVITALPLHATTSNLPCTSTSTDLLCSSHLLPHLT